MVNDTCTLIEYIHSQHMIDKAAKKFLLLPKNTRIPFFYGLHKIHKPRCPLCPIVSGSYGPIDHLSAYNTHFIQSIANNLPSHVKDTKYFHHLIEKLQPLPPNAHLVTVDVTFLYKKNCTRRRHSSRDSLHGRIQAPTTHKPSTAQYSVHNTRFHPQKKQLQIHGHAYTPNPWYAYGSQDGSPLCQSILGQGRTQHNPKLPPLNLHLETFH